MDHQDWITVTVRRRNNKKEQIQKGNTTIQQKDSMHSERIRLAKLDTNDAPPIQKKVDPVTLQAMIRKRIEMKLNQDKADNLCSFPRNTFKEIEAGRLIPSEDQKRRIFTNLSIQLKVLTITNST
jgi:hypothetical protein